MVANLRQRVTAVNGLLAAVYGEETRLSVLLERLGASDTEIGCVREQSLAETCNRVIDAVSRRFQGFRNGSRDFIVLSRCYVPPYTRLFVPTYSGVRRRESPTL
jgi:hypothetical protein